MSLSNGKPTNNELKQVVENVDGDRRGRWNSLDVTLVLEWEFRDVSFTCNIFILWLFDDMDDITTDGKASNSEYIHSWCLKSSSARINTKVLPIDIWRLSSPLELPEVRSIIATTTKWPQRVWKETTCFGWNDFVHITCFLEHNKDFSSIFLPSCIWIYIIFRFAIITNNKSILLLFNWILDFS